MWHFLKRQGWPAVSAAWRGWREHDGLTMAAAMAFYAAFSLFPLLLVAISVAGLVLRYSANAQFHQDKLLDIVHNNVSPWLADQLQLVLPEVQSQAGVSGPLGLVVLIAAAIGVFMQLENSFDRIWEKPSSKRGWAAAIHEAFYDRLIAFVMLLCVGLLLTVVFFADVLLTGLRPAIRDLPSGARLWQAVQTLVATGLYAGLLGVIYKTLPPAPVTWRAALAGGLAAALVWEAGQYVLIAVLIGPSYSAYGIVGSFIALMLWFYYASVVLFLGAEFVRAVSPGRPPAAARGQPGRPANDAAPGRS